MLDPYPSSASDNDDDHEARAQALDEIRKAYFEKCKREQIKKTVQTMGTIESKKKRAKIGRSQALRARQRELALARATYVPFEPSKKKRAEMRSASGERGLRNNPILYMADRSHVCIFRVSKDGDVKPRELVGRILEDDGPWFRNGLPEPLVD